MTRFFNTTGPCQAEIHYMLPTEARLPLARRLIAQRQYFVLHAPRQSGKTTTLMELARALTTEGHYAAVVLSAESGAAFPDNLDAAELAILDSWRNSVLVRLPAALQPPAWPAAAPGGRIRTALRAWAQAAPRPLVVFIDEIDSLADEVLLSVLRQLRDGYYDRPHGFPWSLALMGLRDVRDYKVASGGSDRLHTASPFNIKAESLTLGNFTQAEVAALYHQHTADTGQLFTPEAVTWAFTLSQGQPWLVNALARQAVEVLAPDPQTPVTRDLIEQAKENLIQRQDTHLDSLAERLREPRVRHVIAPLMAGDTLVGVPSDDLQFVVDLGLCQRTAEGRLVIANPVYREVLPRVLADTTLASMPHITPTWLRPDGRLNFDHLLAAFLAFWRQHGQPLLRAVHYHEIAPHIVLMAFLHRVVNGGGSLEREYAIGTRRMDVCLRYGPDVLGMELKVWREHETNPVPEGLTQLDHYLNGLGLETGWLVIFDQRSGQPDIAERTRAAAGQTPQGKPVTLIYA